MTWQICKAPIGLTLALLALIAPLKAETGFTTITFNSLDGLLITADLYRTGSQKQPVIVLFHQSGSSRGEYRAIAPELVKQGFNCLAVDLRWGGNGPRSNQISNETARRHKTAEVVAQNDDEKIWHTIFESRKDMRAAIGWLRKNGYTGSLLVWGSSASSILVFDLASQYEKDIAAVISFSPGEYKANVPEMVRAWARKTQQAVFVACGVDELAVAKPIYEAVAHSRKSFYHAAKGRHGASILIDDSANWPPLTNFLQQFRPSLNRHRQDRVSEGRNRAYAKAAEKAANWIRATAVDSPTGKIWPDDALDAKTISLDLDSGVAGTTLFFLSAYRATRNQSDLQSVQRGGDYLLANLPAKLEDQPGRWSATSLYGGIAGIGFVLHQVYKTTKAEKYRLGAVRCLELLHASAKRDDNGVWWNNTNDILSGSAGSGLFLLYAAREMRHAESKNLAIAVGRKLLGRARREHGGLTWKFNEEREFILPNFSHGAAGIGYFLATLYQETGGKEFLAAALASAKYLQAIAKQDHRGFLVPYGWPDPGWQRPFDIGWAHGPAGTARLFFRLWQITGDPQWMALTHACARSILQSGIPGQPLSHLGKAPFDSSTRFGTAGVGEFLLSLYAETKEPRYLDFARLLVDDVLRKSKSQSNGLQWPITRMVFMPKSGEEAAFTGYFYGAAGYGLLLLHLDAIESGRAWTLGLPDNPFRK